MNNNTNQRVEQAARAYAKEKKVSIQEIKSIHGETLLYYAFKAGWQQSQSPEQEFTDYIKNARQEFVQSINNVERSNYLMTAVDSLLIAYDQMADRLQPLPAPPLNNKDNEQKQN